MTWIISYHLFLGSIMLVGIAQDFGSVIFGSSYSRMGHIKFVGDSL